MDYRSNNWGRRRKIKTFIKMKYNIGEVIEIAWFDKISFKKIRKKLNHKKK